MFDGDCGEFVVREVKRIVAESDVIDDDRSKESGSGCCCLFLVLRILFCKNFTCLALWKEKLQAGTNIKKN